jgi:glucose dehydrogenase
VAYWRNVKDERIFLNTGHRLVAVDAKTGALVTSFGRNGFVDMTDSLRRTFPSDQMRSTNRRDARSLGSRGRSVSTARR